MHVPNDATTKMMTVMVLLMKTSKTKENHVAQEPAVVRPMEHTCAKQMAQVCTVPDNQEHPNRKHAMDAMMIVMVAQMKV